MPNEAHYQPFWISPAVIGAMAVIVLLFWLLDRFMKRYFPSSRRGYTAGGNALMRVEALFLPGRDQVIEAKESEDAEQDESAIRPTLATNRTQL